jgi:hypothetical protein
MTGKTEAAPRLFEDQLRNEAVPEVTVLALARLETRMEVSLGADLAAKISVAVEAGFGLEAASFGPGAAVRTNEEGSGGGEGEDRNEKDESAAHGVVPQRESTTARRTSGVA